MDKNKKEDKKELDTFDTGKFIMCSVAFVAISPMMFPTLAIPSLATLAPYVASVGYAMAGGVCSFVAFDLIKTMKGGK